MTKYNVIKSFRNIDGAVSFPGDVVELDDARASVLRRSNIIGGAVKSPNRGILETATVRTDAEIATAKRATEKAERKPVENRKR